MGVGMVSFLIAADAISTESGSTEPWVVVILALISLAGIVVSAWFGYMAQKHAKEGAKQASEVNEAVNHRKPGQDRLFDMVAEMREDVKDLTEWKEKWDNIPSKLKNPQEIVTSFAILEDRIATVGERVDKNAVDIRHHIDSKIDSIEIKVNEIDSKLTATNAQQEKLEGVVKRAQRNKNV